MSVLEECKLDYHKTNGVLQRSVSWVTISLMSASEECKLDYHKPNECFRGV